MCLHELEAGQPILLVLDLGAERTLTTCKPADDQRNAYSVGGKEIEGLSNRVIAWFFKVFQVFFKGKRQGEMNKKGGKEGEREK